MIRRYVLSKEADDDILQIGRDSIDRWGWDRTERYLEDLHHAFETLAEFPALGKGADHIREGYRRFESGSHSVFYREMEFGVLIVRILHNRMMPKIHL